jgi:apolipoprotein N-acyltransferase
LGSALLAGGLLAVAFLPARLGFLSWFALVPLLAALESRCQTQAPGRSLFGLGFGFGIVFFGIGMHWIALLSNVAITVPWLKYPAWLTAALYLSLFSGAAVWLAGILRRRSGVSLALVFPFAYLAVEELRASGELGFPWFQPGYSQHAYTPLIQMASLGGVTLVTLWVLFVNVLLWQLLTGRSRIATGVAALCALLFPWFWGERMLDAATPKPAAAVSLVQGNIPGEIKWSGRHQKQILDRYLALSAQATADSLRPRIVIWPETATGSYLRKQLDQSLAVATFAARADVPVFSGYPDYALGDRGQALYYNAAGVFYPNGTTSPSYAKRHLVPFGERMPFQRWFPGLGTLELGQAEWTPGASAVLFPSELGPFTALVCFESIFPDLARADIRRGARWLVNITNDEWFGNSAALYQHASMAVFRAVENHVSLARCANTGLTMMIDPNGRVRGRLPVFQAGVLTLPLMSPGPPTWFTRVGDWPGVLSGIVIVGLIVWSLIPSKKPQSRDSQR